MEDNFRCFDCYFWSLDPINSLLVQMVGSQGGLQRAISQPAVVQPLQDLQASVPLPRPQALGCGAFPSYVVAHSAQSTQHQRASFLN